jgi:hypothetical protein
VFSITPIWGVRLFRTWVLLAVPICLFLIYDSMTRYIDAVNCKAYLSEITSSREPKIITLPDGDSIDLSRLQLYTCDPESLLILRNESLLAVGLILLIPSLLALLWRAIRWASANVEKEVALDNAVAPQDKKHLSLLQSYWRWYIFLTPTILVSGIVLMSLPDRILLLLLHGGIKGLAQAFLIAIVLLIVMLVRKVVRRKS